ncbi:MAG: DUF4476 domain-containing protein [Flavisolibacter sp.]|nr:DUF4476 domain-containing protein [Flavisolibacter sp.]
MKNLFLFLAFIAFAACASAQRVYFIYLQSDNNGSFYVKMGDKFYNSSSTGYLILSNLVDSAYNFSIGFPSSQAESKFAVRLEAKDRGFLIKNFDSGLGLFDLQDLTIIREQKDDSPKNISYIRRNDEFSSLLSKAAKDTSLLYSVVRVKGEDVAVKKEQPKTVQVNQKIEEPAVLKDTVASSLPQTDIAFEEKKQDTIEKSQPVPETKTAVDVASTPVKEKLENNTVTSTESKEQSTPNSTSTIANTGTDTLEKNSSNSSTAIITAEDAVFKKSQVRRYSESSTSEGFGLVYYDIYDGGRDTIRLLIPNPPIIFKTAEQDSSLVQKDFIRVNELKKDTVQQTPIIAEVKKNVSAKSQCKALASNNDFFKLRKNMASETTDEGMVAEAKKVFKAKCFTTEQIKNLGALFLTSSGKYQFFDAAYLHVSDQENFSSLEPEIKDDYYLKRFKALIGE